MAENITDDDALFYKPDSSIIWLLSFLYGFLSLFAIVGNGFVIFIIARFKQMQTVTNYFLFNLALADILVAIFAIPFQYQAALLQYWALPDFLCVISPFTKELTVCVSVFTLTAVAFDRYFALLYPLKHMLWTKNLAKIIIACIWCLALAASFPTALSFHLQEWNQTSYWVGMKKRCNMDFTHLYQIYVVAMVALQYLIPLAIITFAYARICYVVWGAETPGQAMSTRDKVILEGKKKTIKMLMAVVLLFGLSWLPIQLFQFLFATYRKALQRDYINIVWFCSNWLAMSNSCHNPVIYGLYNDKFKASFRKIFSCCPCLKRTQPAVKPSYEVKTKGQRRTPAQLKMTAPYMRTPTSSTVMAPTTEKLVLTEEEEAEKAKALAKLYEKEIRKPRSYQTGKVSQVTKL